MKHIITIIMLAIATNSVIPWLKNPADLVYPWTLTMEICKTADTGKRGVILSSDNSEICTDYDRDGKKGLGVIRAAGSRNGTDPFNSHLMKDVSRRYTDLLPGWATPRTRPKRGGRNNAPERQSPHRS